MVEVPGRHLARPAEAPLRPRRRPERKTSFRLSRSDIVNKTDPNGIVDDFVAQAASALADWQHIGAAIQHERIAVRRRSAADAFMALAVSWESFMSEWLVGAVNRDASRTVATLDQKLREHAQEKLRVPAGHVAATLATKGHLSMGEVRGLLDPKDYNVAIRSRDELRAFAAEWLAGAYRAQALGVTAFQFAPVLLTRVIRNALAHRSAAAISEANRVARLGTTPVSFRVAGARKLDVAGWRTYLLQGHNGTPRVELLHTSLSQFATGLKVP